MLAGLFLVGQAAVNQACNTWGPAWHGAWQAVRKLLEWPGGLLGISSAPFLGTSSVLQLPRRASATCNDLPKARITADTGVSSADRQSVATRTAAQAIAQECTGASRPSTPANQRPQKQRRNGMQRGSPLTDIIKRISTDIPAARTTQVRRQAGGPMLGTQAEALPTAMLQQAGADANDHNQTKSVAASDLEPAAFGLAGLDPLLPSKASCSSADEATTQPTYSHAGSTCMPADRWSCMVWSGCFEVEQCADQAELVGPHTAGGPDLAGGNDAKDFALPSTTSEAMGSGSDSDDCFFLPTPPCLTPSELSQLPSPSSLFCLSRSSSRSDSTCFNSTSGAFYSRSTSTPWLQKAYTSHDPRRRSSSALSVKGPKGFSKQGSTPTPASADARPRRRTTQSGLSPLAATHHEHASVGGQLVAVEGWCPSDKASNGGVQLPGYSKVRASHERVCGGSAKKQLLY